MHARIQRVALAAALTLLLAPASASAYFAHVVARGETLTSVAAADGLSVAQLAAANGLSPGAELTAGATLQIPPQSAPVSPPASSSAAVAAPESETSSAPVDTSDSGGYVVAPGDTLTAIAARDGVSVEELAAANGLNPQGLLLAGITLRLPAAGTGSATEYVSSTPAQSQAAAGGPYPTPETVSSSQIAGIASSEAVPAPLAQAIGWQESGWNNDEVSGAGAVGVMQIMPGTWNWIQNTLTAGTPLSSYSASDNVRGGVLMLHSLLADTGSDSLAAAGYYQGLASVREHGLYPSTQQYVNDVMALEARFGGG